MKGITRATWLSALLVALIAAIAVGCGTGESSESASKCDGAVEQASVADGRATGDALPGSIPEPNPAGEELGQSADDDCLYEGAGGFELDINRCPADWDINAGISRDEIKIFTSLPHSGPLAAYGAIGDGIDNYLEYVNEHGGVDGRRVSLHIDDDQYQPDLTRKNVDAAIQGNEYAASFAIVGSPNNMNVWDTMNQNCMPQLLVGASDDVNGDVVDHPWTTMQGLNYANETALWGEWLKREFPDGADVAAITINNQMGQSYFRGFEKAVDGTNLRIVGNELHDVAAPSIQNQITSAAATRADVVVINDAGTFCTQALAGIERSSWKPVVITAQPCAQIPTTYGPLREQGLTGNGTNVIRYYYAPTDSDADDREFADLMLRTLRGGGLDPENAQFANGWFWGWYVVQTLKDATVMRGGLNRANIMIAARAYDSTYPLMIDGVRGRMNGVEDAYPFEAGRMYRYDGATPNKLGDFVPAGPLIDNEGRLRNWTEFQKQG